jgi:hypothetical protein
MPNNAMPSIKNCRDVIFKIHLCSRIIYCVGHCCPTYGLRAREPLKIIYPLSQSIGIMLVAIGAFKLYLQKCWANYCVLVIGLIGSELISRLTTSTFKRV